MEASFIIPHKGREELLIQTVESILNLDFDMKSIEVIVVTQNEKLDALNGIQLKYSNIKVFFQPNNITISALRNYGAKKAKGKFLAFLDADIFLDENWLKVMIDELNDSKERILISSIQKNSTDHSSIENVRTSLNNIHKNSIVESLAGSNLFIKKNDFDNSNKFPEKMLTCEDIYFTNQLSKRGKLFLTSKTAHIHLGEDKSYSQLFKKEIWRGQSNIMSLKGRKIPLKELPSVLVPIAIMCLMVIMISKVVTQQYVYALYSTLLFLLPLSAYSIRLSIHTDYKVSLFQGFKFYITYFPARALGTLGGLLKAISSSRHK